MIVNSFDENKIKILVDKIDLDKKKISLKSLISTPSTTLSYIKEFLIDFDIFLENKNIKNYSIFSYDYKVFMIIVNT